LLRCPRDTCAGPSRRTPGRCPTVSLDHPYIGWAPITLAEDQRRSARIIRHSRVYSSIRLRVRTLRPSLQPFATSDPRDSILAHLPAGTHQHRRDPAIPIAPILAGQRDHGLRQSIFVFSLCGTVALRAPGLPQQKARMPVTHTTPTGMAHRTTSSLRV
jgi:hypothetical protein